MVGSLSARLLIKKPFKTFWAIPNIQNTKKIVKTLLDNFHKLGCNISVKVHFLHSLLE